MSASRLPVFAGRTRGVRATCGPGWSDRTQYHPYAPQRKWIGRCGVLLPLFRLVGVLWIAALWRVKSLRRHRS